MAKAPKKATTQSNEEMILDLMEKIEAQAKEIAALQRDQAPLALDLTEKIEGLAKRQDSLEAEKGAFTEGLAGRLMKTENRMMTIETRAASAGAGTPDLLARSVLGTMLKLLEAQWREFTTARQILAKDVLAMGKPLLAEDSRPAGHIEKQLTVKDLQNA